MKQIREVSLEYATPVASESSPIQMVMEPQVHVGHNSYLARVLPHAVLGLGPYRGACCK